MHKQSRTPSALLWLVAGALWAALGCGQTSSETTPEPSEHSGSVQFVASTSQALAGDDVTRVTVTLTATGVPASTTTLTLADGTWSGTLYQVPAGANRTFTAEAFDAQGALRYRGQATGITIVERETAVVAITLQSIDTTPAFDNTVPCINSLVASASTVLPGGSIALSATVQDPDTSDTLTYAWTATGGTFASTGTAITTWTAPQTPGAYALTLTVTDSRGAATSMRIDINTLSPEGGPGVGNASVSVSFNTTPAVSRITVSRSPVPVGQSTTVTVEAADADGDSLSYQWTASCAGTWTDATSATASFTPGAVPSGDACGNCPLTVAITDPKGGRSQGTLRVCVGPETGASIPPRIVLTNQSATSVAGGGNVTLRVLAEDGDGSALTFGWAASTGTVGTPSNGFTSSEVRWTAPACVSEGAAPTITATVTNARGFSASHTFSVSVLNGSDCVSGGLARWEATGSMLTPRAAYASVLLPSGKVLVSGGYNPAVLSSAEIYSPDTGTWSSAGNMSSPRWLHTMTVLPSGKVLVIGGSPTSTGSLRSVDIYDPATNSWTAAAPTIFDRTGHTATLLPSGKVLVVGGNVTSGVSQIPELYDPATNTWLPVASMAATQRYYHVALPLPSGKILVIGGGNNASELYDPATDLWTPGGVWGDFTQAYLQPSGKVLLVLGQNLAMYDPALNTQTSAGAMVQSRSHHILARLASGRLLFTGGGGTNSVLAELYDPATGTASYTMSMPSPRYYTTGFLLPSGKVLIAGGADSSGYTNTALLYTP